MSVIALIGNKGGVGKTTLAINLSTLLNEKSPTYLLDADPQGSAMHWSAMIDNEDMPTVFDATVDVGKAVKKYRDEVEHVLIDCPPQLHSKQVSICTETLTKLSRLVGDAITELNIPAAKTALHRRVVYRSSVLEGKSVTQMGRPGSFAADEINNVLAEVLNTGKKLIDSLRKTKKGPATAAVKSATKKTATSKTAKPKKSTATAKTKTATKAKPVKAAAKTTAAKTTTKAKATKTTAVKAKATKAKSVAKKPAPKKPAPVKAAKAKAIKAPPKAKAKAKSSQARPKKQTPKKVAVISNSPFQDGSQPLDEMKSVLKEDFKFSGSFYQYESAEDYIQSLKENMPADDVSYEILRELEKGDSCCIVYRSVSQEKDEVMAQLFETSENKITQVRLILDANNLLNKL
ncbi:hypothetical protein GQR58_006672 [Nymphon striatum]|nr:hypothetical protein GQR58_006672 [Nymphon striatum]